MCWCSIGNMISCTHIHNVVKEFIPHFCQMALNFIITCQPFGGMFAPVLQLI